jgi:hypothetical protein
MHNNARCLCVLRPRVQHYEDDGAPYLLIDERYGGSAWVVAWLRRWLVAWRAAGGGAGRGPGWLRGCRPGCARA